ncbi:hypothetical protein J2S43_006477 [Catenuloplanes nepalensis]|uniref:DUF4265 domain-containing protein n=1 Tax=Catenuloplanes nepalensis TaxID=587533 RepID=A0ABT9N2Q3_9ACTN|nr:hypothetical protein [Catenuloplanes nepalensis]MDP9797965.1 hypothetical protein [Catenuloplanes nepalensis]
MVQQWAIVLPDERLKQERLYHHDFVELADVLAEIPASAHPELGDEVVLVTDEPKPRAVATGHIGGLRKNDEDDRQVVYSRRAFDQPHPAGPLTLDGPVTRLTPAEFAAVLDRFGPPLERSTWLVSVDLPIEATTRAEAVRLFWSYVRELGPAELPAFVSPAGDELAMQAFVLGEETNLDPEEEDED